MSKIIVDQIQSNGGDVLTVPTTDATLANQPIVGSTSGVLTFSPLALPSADGDANKPITTDGSAQLQFGAFALPTTAGTDGQVLTSTGTAAAWETQAIPPSGFPTHDNSDEIIGSLVTTTGRGHGYSNGRWTTSGPNSTYQSHNAFSSHSDETWNMLMGDGHPNSSGTDRRYVNNTRGDVLKEVDFAYGNRIGDYFKDFYHQNNQTSYSGITFRALPIRNTSGASINISVYAYGSAYADSYSGTALAYYTPTYSSGTNYANVTGGSWTALANSSSSSTAYNYGANTVAVPAGTTVIVVLVSGHSYQTSYRFVDTNTFYNLDTTFSSSSIICDVRMLYTMQQARAGSGTGTAASNSAAYPYRVYQLAAELYGDR